jgi:hypothetical protein
LRLFLLAACILGVFVTASACSPFSSKTASAARTATPAKPPVPGDRLDPPYPTPAAFPPDVPVYPGARLTSGAGFTSPGQLAFGMEWQTLDSVDKVQAFYKTKLSTGDWQIVFNGSANNAFSANYSRKSNPKVGGMLGADGSSGITRITLSLVMPT